MIKKAFQWLAFLLIGLLPGYAQESKEDLPVLAGAAVPLYPELARAARIEGIVRIDISTDGREVITTHVKDGPKLLSSFAEENARTWRFLPHEPATFTITYSYKIDAKMNAGPNNPVIVLRPPTEVQISVPPRLVAH